MRLTQKKLVPPVNNFSTVTVNWAMQLKFLYQEQLSGGQAIWTAIANAHQGKKGHPAKKQSTESCLMSSEEATPKAGEEFETETERKSCLEFKSL